jgi:hypothetical protein
LRPKSIVRPQHSHIFASTGRNDTAEAAMTTATAQGHSAISNAPRQAGAGFFAGLVEGWRLHMAFRQNMRELSTLSSLELESRGIDRRMMTRVALEQATRKVR